MSIGDEAPNPPIKIEQFRRKTFDVDAVQVTPENLEDVAKWCGGDVRTEQQKGKNVRFVKVRVYKALDEEQTKAFPGNFVVYMGSGYKVYKYNAFMRTFDRVPKPPAEEAAEWTEADLERNRSAVTGQFVTDEFAHENPDTTVTEAQG